MRLKQRKNNFSLYFKLSICLKGLSLLLSFFLLTKPVSAADLLWQKKTVTKPDFPAESNIQVYASVGGYLFEIQGLTSPWAKVDFHSTEGNIKLHTVADNQGKFVFRDVLIPFKTGDFCFISYDVDGLANAPLCFTPPPPHKINNKITGVILSPSLSIDKTQFRQGETAKAEGRAIPNTNIEIFLFEEERFFLFEVLDAVVPHVSAREGPKVGVESNQEGHFEINLPSFKSTRWKIFVGDKLEDNLSPQSNALTFRPLSWWQWMLIKILRWSYDLGQRISRFIFRWETLVFALIVALVFMAKGLKSNPESKRKSKKK